MNVRHLSIGYVMVVAATLVIGSKLVSLILTTELVRSRVNAQAATILAGTTDWLDAARHPSALGRNKVHVERAHAALSRKFALPSEAARANTALHIVLLSVVTDIDGAAFAKLRLDVTRLSKTAVLVIAETPLEVQIIGASVDQRAKIAFESRAPVMAAAMPQGLLAGLRIQGFDVHDAIGPDVLDANRSTFCAAIAGWQAMFRQRPADVDIWRIAVADGAVITMTEGAVERASPVGTLGSLCS